jgi:uncharacterized protein (DUF302 family)
MSVNRDPSRVLQDERAAGKRAPFHVYYTERGKVRVTAAYASTEAGAKAFARGAFRELRMKAEVLDVVATVGGL